MTMTVQPEHPVTLGQRDEEDGRPVAAGFTDQSAPAATATEADPAGRGPLAGEGGTAVPGEAVPGETGTGETGTGETGTGETGTAAPDDLAADDLAADDPARDDLAGPADALDRPAPGDDLAGPADALDRPLVTPDRPSGAQPGATSALGQTPGGVTPAAELSAQQWPAIMALFVDDPRGAVQRAAAAAEELAAALIASLEREQTALRAAWERDADTEKLRTALQQYRSFCGRLSELGLS
jgi:hypothetical protein